MKKFITVKLLVLAICSGIVLGGVAHFIPAKAIITENGDEAPTSRDFTDVEEKVFNIKKSEEESPKPTEAPKEVEPTSTPSNEEKPQESQNTGSVNPTVNPCQP